jgi:hypothetical protein
MGDVAAVGELALVLLGPSNELFWRFGQGDDAAGPLDLVPSYML